MAAELMSLLPYVLALLALVVCSAFFSGTEVAMFSLRRVDRQQIAASKKRVDQIALGLISKPRRLIATILLGNESVNVAVSAVCAGLVQQAFSSSTELQKGLLATFIALPLLLFLGEITPKTIAIKKSRGWVARAARPLWLFGTIVKPLRIVVSAIANALMYPLGGSTERSGPRDLSEDEFKALVDAGRAEGEIEAGERHLIHRVFEFGEKTVQQIMKPRDAVFAISYDLPLARLIKTVAEGGFSRVPIFHKSLENVRGILYAKDLVSVAAGSVFPQRLADVLHDALFVPQTTRLERLFAIFKKGKTHMALVVDEYGKLVGIVTMEDVLEELFGEIRDERESLKDAAATQKSQNRLEESRRMQTEEPL